MISQCSLIKAIMVKKNYKLQKKKKSLHIETLEKKKKKNEKLHNGILKQ